MFSREFWCLVSISRGGNADFPPADGHGQKTLRHFFEKFRQYAQILKSRVSVAEFLMKSRSRPRLEIFYLTASPRYIRGCCLMLERWYGFRAGA